MIPLVDLRAQYRTIKDEIDEAVRRVIENTTFILGEETERFEEEFSGFSGARFCVGCASGTDAIVLALEGLGVGPGDEVITVSFTFFATAEAISIVGATPVFIDVDSDSLLMDPTKIEAAITERTKAIVPVHLYGQPVDMQPIMELAQRHGLVVVEDAAQAHGATYRGNPVGTLGHAGIFSFYPGKNLGAYGDAGCIVTGDPELATWLRMARDHGRTGKYVHDFVARSSRMDGIQAAVLRAKLPHLRRWNNRRAELAKMYTAELRDLPNIQLPQIGDAGEHVFHLYVVKVSRRDQILAQLQARGIGAGVHYPVPVHQQPAYAGRRHAQSDLPVTIRASTEVLSLPIYPEFGAVQLEEVVAALKFALAG